MGTPNYVRELRFPDGVFCRTAEWRNDGVITRVVAEGVLGGGGAHLPSLKIDYVLFVN